MFGLMRLLSCHSRCWLNFQITDQSIGDYKAKLYRIAEPSQLPIQHHGELVSTLGASDGSKNDVQAIFVPPPQLVPLLSSAELITARLVCWAWHRALAPPAAEVAVPQVAPLRPSVISDRWNYLHHLHEVWSAAPGAGTLASRLRSRGLMALADVVQHRPTERQPELLAAADALCELGNRNQATDLWQAVHGKLRPGGMPGLQSH